MDIFVNKLSKIQNNFGYPANVFTLVYYVFFQFRNIILSVFISLISSTVFSIAYHIDIK